MLFSDIELFNTDSIFIEKESVLEPEYISGFVAADGTFLSLNRQPVQNDPITMQHLLLPWTKGMKHTKLKDWYCASTARGSID